MSPPCSPLYRIPLELFERLAKLSISIINAGAWCLAPNSLHNWIRYRFQKNLFSYQEILKTGAKQFPLSSQRPFHFHCSIDARFNSDQTNTIKGLIFGKSVRILLPRPIFKTNFLPALFKTNSNLTKFWEKSFLFKLAAAECKPWL